MARRWSRRSTRPATTRSRRERARAMSQTIEIPITGMTCASCANRIERRLNKLESVSASVNYATERATVDYDPAAVAPEQLVRAVEAAGYRASLPTARDGLSLRLAVSAALSVPIVALSTLGGGGWLALALATPVVLWGAWPFHRAALT